MTTLMNLLKYGLARAVYKYLNKEKKSAKLRPMKICTGCL